MDNLKNYTVLSFYYCAIFIIVISYFERIKSILDNLFFESGLILSINLFISDILLSNLILLLITFILVCYYITVMIINHNHTYRYSIVYIVYSLLGILYLCISLVTEYTSYVSCFISRDISVISFISETNFTDFLIIVVKIAIIVIFFLFIFLLNRENIVDKGLVVLLLWMVLFSFFYLVTSNNFFTIALLIEFSNFCSITLFFLFTNKNNNYNEILKLESSIKFFLLNAFSGCLLFLGLAWLYLLTGTLNLSEINDILLYPIYNKYYTNSLLLVFIIIMISFFIKVGVFPYHQWTLDIVVGLPFIILYFFFTFSKIVYLFFLNNLYIIFMLHINNIYFEYIFTIIIVLNIIFSAVNALYDTRLKRILVFSSMSSVSIILLGWLCLDKNMLNATIIYVLFSIYSYANYVYILSIIKYNSEYASSSSLLLKHKNELTTINDLNSLCFSNKLLSFILISTLLSLIGLPPFIGFIYKYAIFISFSSYSQTCIINICIFTITVVISFYYLRICRNILSSSNYYYYYLYLPLSRNVLYLTVIMFYFNTYVFFISIDHIFVYLNLFY